MLQAYSKLGELDLMYLNRAKERYEDMLKTLNWVDKTQACTLDQVCALEQKMGFALPIAYQEFLLWMGCGAGEFMQGEDFQFGQLDSIREAAFELRDESQFSEPFPKESIIFTMHQGCFFGFLIASEGDNPPVHFYIEQKGGGGQITWNQHSNLEAYLISYINDTMQLLARRQQSSLHRNYTNGSIGVSRS